MQVKLAKVLGSQALVDEYMGKLWHLKFLEECLFPAGSNNS